MPAVHATRVEPGRPRVKLRADARVMPEDDVRRLSVPRCPENAPALLEGMTALVEVANREQRGPLLLLDRDPGDDPRVHDANPVLGEIDVERRGLEE